MSQFTVIPANNNNSSASNGKSNGSSSAHKVNIPMNSGGKAYNLPEAFDVWNQNKDNILNGNYGDYNLNSDESFKLSSATPIEHLNGNVGESFSKLSINDNDHVNSNLLNTSSAGLNPSETGQGSSNGTVDSPQLILPSNINWYYLDSSGNEQGPFNGDLMQSWFSEGYLAYTLPLSQKSGEGYTTLKQFCDSIGNYVTPFATPLPPPVATSSLPGASIPGSAPANQPLNQSLSQLLLNNHFSLPLFSESLPQSFGQSTSLYQSFHQAPSILQQQPLSRTSSNWAVNDFSTASPIAVNTSQLNNPISQTASPWTAHVQTSSRSNSPFVGETKKDSLLNDILSNIVSSTLNDQPIQESHSSIEQPKVVIPEEPLTSTIGADIIEQPRVITEEIVQPKVIKEPIEQPTVVIPSYENVEQEPIVVEVVKEEPALPTVADLEDAALDKLSPKIESLKPSTTASTKAPWAEKPKPVEDAPKLTLKEIQRLENEKFIKQKKAEAEAKLELQAKLIQEAKNLEEKEVTKSSGLPTTSSWADLSNSKTPKVKTLAQIQEEERKASELLKASKKQPVGHTVAGAIAASSPATSDAWTTVSNTRKPQTKSTSTGTSRINSSNSVPTLPNPQLLRAVSGTVPQTKVDNSDSLREEFVIWARSQMVNLYPTVSQNDLLEMFISLPNNPDSALLIGETIYSSSATMNGRVFAQEFLKKRASYERQLSNPRDLGAWSTAIVQSADKVLSVDEEGWSTSTKSKKRGKKN